MSNKPYSILILCTGNSAGSHPPGTVNPFAIERCKALGYDVSQMRSKSWDEFATPEAPQMDFVITVCDQAAGESCPLWPGKPMTAHWGFQNPAAFEGTDEEKRAFFNKIYRQIMNRVSQFVNLPLHVLNRNSVQHEMRVIGNRPAEGTNEQH
ncbi:arsenate reductase ArsC [Caballeronia glebae]|uniref:Protein tyrosine phosphatase n=1 Tax=Caballeronia glebae TaxID=1777143 RepID=A0A158C1D5_9BURK|nr:arsenate reductase ArsC [Caballeronia glebae]SAK76123.1 protein tyrosine phosphatase [Caballeronia glebae]